MEGKRREGNINVWLPLMYFLPGTWSSTQTCALTGNQIGEPLNQSPCSIHYSIPPGSFLSFFLILIFYCYSITVVCLVSPSLHPTNAKHLSSPTSTLPLHFVPVSFIVGPAILFPPHSPLPIVTLFLTSMFLVIFCFLFFFYLLCSS